MIKGFCYSGPHDSQDIWQNYRGSAERAFTEYGLSVTSAFSDCDAIPQVSQPEFTFYYTIAHCSWREFICEPGKRCTVDDIRKYLKDRGRIGFAFLGHCHGMVKTGSGSFSHTFRKGKLDSTVTVGYYRAEQSTGWPFSLRWQERFFTYLKEGMKFGVAFDEAVADYPEIAEMVRLKGDPNLTLEEAKKIREKETEEEERKGCLGVLRTLLRR